MRASLKTTAAVLFAAFGPPALLWACLRFVTFDPGLPGLAAILLAGVAALATIQCPVWARVALAALYVPGMGFVLILVALSNSDL